MRMTTMCESTSSNGGFTFHAQANKGTGREGLRRILSNVRINTSLNGSRGGAPYCAECTHVAESENRPARTFHGRGKVPQHETDDGNRTCMAPADYLWDRACADDDPENIKVFLKHVVDLFVLK